MTFDPKPLVEAAEKAGGKRWEVYSEPEVNMPPTLMELGERDGWFTPRRPIEPFDDARLDFIASANPSAIIAWGAAHAAQAAEIERLREAKDGAYLERNRLVALIAGIFPSVRCRTAIEGWSDDWHGCVYITLPSGQASWHFHDSQAHLFAHVPEGVAAWDGHTTDEKYARIEAALIGGASHE